MKLKFKTTSAAFIVIMSALGILSVIGYILCIVKLVQCDFSPINKAEIVYGIGVLSGMGAIFGWLNLGK